MPQPKSNAAPDFIPASASPDFIPADHGNSTPPDVQPEPTLAQRGVTGLKNIGIGALKSGVALMSTGDEWARKHLPAFFTNTDMGFGPPANLQHVHEMATPQGTAQKVGYGLGEAAQFLIPGGTEEKAVSLAPAVLRPAARIGAAALSSGLVNKAQGGNFGTGALMGGAGGAIGEGLQKVAPSLAETALNVRGNQRLFGRTVGKAILNDTGRSVRPESIGRAARETIQRLSPEIEAADLASAQSGVRGSLNPARQAVGKEISRHAGNRAIATANEIKPVQDFLNVDQLTKQPLAPNQAAPGLRSLKRGLASDFISTWKPEESVERKEAARRAYGLLNQELHRISPETESLDQRISSLYPVEQQGRRVASNAPLPQRVMGRIKSHSGVLGGAAGFGGLAGYQMGGKKGAIEGALTGLVAPELLASPEGQMAVARMMHCAGTLRPATAAALQFTSRKGGQ